MINEQIIESVTTEELDTSQKKCCICEKIQDIDNFLKDELDPTVRRKYCKSCHEDILMKYIIKEQEIIRERHRRSNINVKEKKEKINEWLNKRKHYGKLMHEIRDMEANDLIRKPEVCPECDRTHLQMCVVIKASMTADSVRNNPESIKFMCRSCRTNLANESKKRGIEL